MQNQNKKFYDYFNNYIDNFELEDNLKEAMKYSFNSNGKLIRPNLFWSMLDDLNVTEDYLEIALSIEMIHTYSLIHDDLPAMDNDDYRRGKLTCHKVFGEDIAILTGDALLTQAFDIVANCDIEANRLIQIIKAITEASGIAGMIDGQVMDVKNENDPNLSLETLKLIHDKKTAKLIELPIKCAQLVAGINIPQANEAARKLGLFYQIQDDYLDRYGDFSKTGKATNADENKVTYSSLYTKIELEQLLDKLADEILMAYNNLPKTKDLILQIVKREG